MIYDICVGLEEIHKKNLIHRDIKPENLFISKDYKIKSRQEKDYNFMEETEEHQWL